MSILDPTETESKKEIHILVVDDDDASAIIIEHTLKGADFTVVCVADGESALEILLDDTSKFNCIILDCMLPGIDGIEVLRRLKSNREVSNIPVIIETALNDAENISNGFKHGAFSYITKPLDLDLLRSMVHAAFVRYHKNFADNIDKQNAARSLEMLSTGTFNCRTIDDAQRLARTLALACPEPDRVASGLLELLINGIEHGNLGITYEDKTNLILSETWRKEVDRRLEMDCYRDKKVVVGFERLASEIIFTIHDEGPGFDCMCFLDFNSDRALHPHGRGIAMACTFNLDNVEYLGCGNTVKVTIKT